MTDKRYSAKLSHVCLSRKRGAKAWAILYIQSHRGLDAVPVGARIQHATPDGMGGWVDTQSTVTAQSLQDAADIRAGVASAPAGCNGHTAYLAVSRG